MPLLLLILRLTLFVVGLLLVVIATASAVKTFVLPRSATDRVVRFVFRNLRRLFDFWVRRAPDYPARDAIMALYGPVALLALLPTWLLIIGAGYTLMYWALGAESWYVAYELSGSSLLTLGFAHLDNAAIVLLSFTEAMLGLIILAILIAYLPTIYSAFSRREATVSMLEVRAGSPPSAVETIRRYQRLHGLAGLSDMWPTWEVWFTELEESHTSLAALVFFRSPKPQRSWVTAAGAVLDTAALVNAVVDIPHDMRADLTIRAGYLALRSIADVFGVEYDPHPQPSDPISVTRAEFDTACDEMAAQGVPLKADREAAWQTFAGWRVNYDRPLVALALITMAPFAPWSSDRRPAAVRDPLRLVKDRRAAKLPPTRDGQAAKS